jgi:hypothetical protein
MRLSSLKQDFSVFYKTFQSFPRLFSSFQGSYFLYSFCFSRHFRHEILQSFIKLSSLLQDFPVFYKTFQSFTRLSSLLQNFPYVCSLLHDFTCSHFQDVSLLQDFPVISKTFQSFTRLSSQSFTRPQTFPRLQSFTRQCQSSNTLFCICQDNVNIPRLYFSIWNLKK